MAQEKYAFSGEAGSQQADCNVGNSMPLHPIFVLAPFGIDMCLPTMRHYSRVTVVLVAPIKAEPAARAVRPTGTARTQA